MNQNFSTTGMSVIIEGATYSGSAFGANDKGEAVFFNSRIVERMELEEGQLVYAHCIPNYEDKRDQIPWRCIRVEDMDSEAVEGFNHAVDREERKEARDARVAKKLKEFMTQYSGAYTIEDLAYETGLSKSEVESVVTVESNGFKEVSAYALVEE